MITNPQFFKILNRWTQAIARDEFTQDQEDVGATDDFLSLSSGRVSTYFDQVGTVGMELDYSWSFVPFRAVCVHAEFPGNRATAPNRK